MNLMDQMDGQRCARKQTLLQEKISMLPMHSALQSNSSACAVKEGTWRHFTRSDFFTGRRLPCDEREGG